MKKLLMTLSSVAIMSVSLNACATNMAGPSNYADIVKAAQAAHAEAKAGKNVWKQKKMKKAYVDHYLAKAEEALKKGDDAGALKFAKLALKVANAEVDQLKRYADEKPMWEK